MYDLTGPGSHDPNLVDVDRRAGYGVPVARLKFARVARGRHERITHVDGAGVGWVGLMETLAHLCQFSLVMRLPELPLTPLAIWSGVAPTVSAGRVLTLFDMWTLSNLDF